MAEVFGLLVAGAQIFQQTFGVISTITYLSSEIQDDLGSFARQLSHVDILLGLIRTIEQDSLPTVRPHVKSCLEELKILRKRLEKISSGSRRGWVNRLQMAVKVKAHERETASAWKRVEAKTTALSLALELGNCQAMAGISKHIVAYSQNSQSLIVVRIPVRRNRNNLANNSPSRNLRRQVTLASGHLWPISARFITWN
jgi:hypothetical protein